MLDLKGEKKVLSNRTRKKRRQCTKKHCNESKIIHLIRDDE